MAAPLRASETALAVGPSSSDVPVRPLIVPARRLLAAVAIWTGAAALAVALPPLWPLLVVAAVVVAALAGWDVRLLLRAAPLHGDRELPVRAFVGRQAAVRLRLQNPGSSPVLCDVVDEAPEDLAAAGETQTAIYLAPGGAAVVSYAIRPRQRGDRRFGALVLLVRSPLGFFHRRQTVAAAALLRVYPDTARMLHSVALEARGCLEVIGVKPAPRRGQGMEFDFLRDYVPGDDPRRVDWRTTARRGRLTVRQLRHERNHTVMIAVDTSRLMAGETDGRSKLDHAIDAALALGYVALSSGDRVGLLAFDRRIVASLAPRPTRRQFSSVLELLRPLQARLVEPDYGALVRALAPRQRALVVVLTDFVEASAERLTGPLAVLARRHRLLLVALRDRVFATLDVPRHEPVDLYRRIVVADLLREREHALNTLRHGGAQTVDLPPPAITAAVLNSYLAIRFGPDR